MLQTSLAINFILVLFGSGIELLLGAINPFGIEFYGSIPGS